MIVGREINRNNVVSSRVSTVLDERVIRLLTRQWRGRCLWFAQAFTLINCLFKRPPVSQRFDVHRSETFQIKIPIFWGT